MRESKRDASGEPARAQRGEPSRIDRSDLVLPAWQPPPDVVHFEYAEWDLYIDKTEVTVRAYRECVKAGTCSEPGPDAIAMPYRDAGKESPKPDACPRDQFNWAHPDRDEHPVNCVTFSQAWRYCQFRGKRLPVAKEWEAAAGWQFPRERLPIKTKYPWGDAPLACDRAVIRSKKSAQGCADGQTMPVGSKPLGATASGILDMSGNVSEMVMGDWNAAVSDRSSNVKGGSYADSADTAPEIGATHRDYPGATVGFRCVVWPPRNGRDIAEPKRGDWP